MSETEIKNILFDILRHIAPDTDPSVLKPEDNIRETLGIDSYDSLQVIVAIDERLGVDIPEQDYGKVATLKMMIEYIQTRKK
jgi:acyl carrier protein